VVGASPRFEDTEKKSSAPERGPVSTGGETHSDEEMVADALAGDDASSESE
jgi:hypothetical protein